MDSYGFVTSRDPDFLRYIVTQNDKPLSLIAEFAYGSGGSYVKFHARKGPIIPTLTTHPFTVYRRLDSDAVRSEWKRIWSNEEKSKELLVI